MKPWGKVFSIRGGNTLFEGQQINGQNTDRTEDTEKRRHTHREEKRRHTQRRETQKRETEVRSKMQIKEYPSSRSKEEQGPLRDTTSEGLGTL
jgi:hypothetical protein